MKFIKDLLEFWWNIFLSTIIRPWYYFFRILFENKKLSKNNYFKE